MDKIINDILTIILGIIIGHHLSLICIDKVSYIDR